VKLGLIAGNGSFPLLVLDAARAQGFAVVVAAIKEEASPALESRGAAALYWLSLGELSKLIETFKREGVQQAIMAGQVKHKQIFSSIKPDWKLAKLLLSLRSRNTDALIGAVANVLADEGITLLDSTSFLEPLLVRSGVLTRRPPTEQELSDLAYGRAVARHLAQYDIGQTVVVAEAACVAVEAMEGTDATIERAGQIMASLQSQGQAESSPAFSLSTLHPNAPESGALGSPLRRTLTVIKVAKPNQDIRYEVPVVGVRTLEVMHRAGASCLALDAGKCLLLDGDKIFAAADAADITIVAD